jgi:predicted protein tyrosine phosphatase
MPNSLFTNQIASLYFLRSHVLSKDSIHCQRHPFSNAVTECPSAQLPKIRIASYTEASNLLSSQTKIAHLISIGEPGTEPPPRYERVPHRLRLEFDDITQPDNAFGYRTVTPEDIQQVIDFASEIAPTGGDVLVHCASGISRSSAVALIIYAIFLGRDKEEEAMECVLQSRPIAVPNLWVVKLADRALDRGGKLERVAQMHEDWVFQGQDEGF